MSQSINTMDTDLIDCISTNDVKKLRSIVMIHDGVDIGGIKCNLIADALILCSKINGNKDDLLDKLGELSKIEGSTYHDDILHIISSIKKYKNFNYK